MSESSLFIVGAIIFVITVYGVVMAGGLLLTRRQLDEDQDLTARADRDVRKSGLPVNIKY